MEENFIVCTQRWHGGSLSIERNALWRAIHRIPSENIFPANSKSHTEWLDTVGPENPPPPSLSVGHPSPQGIGEVWEW
jgi:hypothetical protein